MPIWHARLGLSGRLFPVACFVAQIAGVEIGGARAIGRFALICERESEIEKFRAQEFWTIERNSPPTKARLSLRI